MNISDESIPPPAQPALPICAAPEDGRNLAKPPNLKNLPSCCAEPCESSMAPARLMYRQAKPSSPIAANGYVIALREKEGRNTLRCACLHLPWTPYTATSSRKIRGIYPPADSVSPLTLRVLNSY